MILISCYIMMLKEGFGLYCVKIFVNFMFIRKKLVVMHKCAALQMDPL